ncbi:unnamed protein product [Coregonus sp. 'balchen']|nr:unnamed protein product [Coregonus sp. 'balchen']
MPRFSSQPAATSIRLGDSQVLACDVNPDLVPLARWEREREPLELSARLVQLPNGALVVSNASEADAGLYRCMVENAGPAKTSEEAQLTILPETGEERKLEFLVEPLPVTKVVGASVLLPCVVTGYPAPYVRWMVGDKLVEESSTRFLCALCPKCKHLKGWRLFPEVFTPLGLSVLSAPPTGPTTLPLQQEDNKAGAASRVWEFTNENPGRASHS